MHITINWHRSYGAVRCPIEYRVTYCRNIRSTGVGRVEVNQRCEEENSLDQYRQHFWFQGSVWPFNVGIGLQSWGLSKINEDWKNYLCFKWCQCIYTILVRDRMMILDAYLNQLEIFNLHSSFIERWNRGIFWPMVISTVIQISYFPITFYLENNINFLNFEYVFEYISDFECVYY